MKKIYTLLYFVPSICFAQLAVPNGTVQSSVNPETGNVGVGTLSPQAKLDVDFNSERKRIQFYQPSTQNSPYEMVSSLRYVWYDNNADIGMVRSGSYPIDALNIRFNNEEKIRFKSNGNVGIGTTNPDKLLTLSPDSYLGWEYSKGQGSYHTITGGGINPMAFSVTPFSNPNGTIFSFRGYSGEKLTILNSGNVGIGTSFPTEKLEIFNSTTTPGTISLRSNRNDAANVEVGKIVAKQDVQDIAKISLFRGGGGHTGYIGFFTKATNESPVVQTLTLSVDGKLGIGTTNPSSKLDVAGNAQFLDFVSGGSNSWIFHTPDDGRTNLHIAPRMANNEWDWNKSFIIEGATGNVAISNKLEAKEIKVTTTPTADFVFEENYHLPKLEDVEKHIKEKKHLPEIASAKEMEANGVNVGEFQIKLLQKIEELTLYTIEQNKLSRDQADQILQMKKEIGLLKNTK